MSSKSGPLSPDSHGRNASRTSSLFSSAVVMCSPRSSRRAAIQVLWSRTDHSAYAVLRDTVTALAERYNPGLDVSDATNLAWSAMQGLIVLYPKISLVRAKTGQADEDALTTAEHFGRLLAAGFCASSA